MKMRKWTAALIGMTLLATVGCQEIGQRALGRPSYTESDVLSLTVNKAAASKLWPKDTTWIRCTKAEYRSGPRIWVVSCSYYVNRDAKDPKETRAYQMSDIDGRLIE